MFSGSAEEMHPGSPALESTGSTVLALESTSPLSPLFAAGHSIKCEYTAHKEGVLREEMVLCSEADDLASIKVVVQARVMGKSPEICLSGARRSLKLSGEVKERCPVALFSPRLCTIKWMPRVVQVLCVPVPPTAV